MHTRPPSRSRKEVAARFAAKVASDPSAVITFWKTLTGGKAVVCLPANPVPEILHAAGLLSLTAETGEDLSRFRGCIDAAVLRDDMSAVCAPSDPRRRFLYPASKAKTLEEALDRVEAFSEWAGVVSRTPVSEGSLWRSIWAYNEQKRLLLEWSRRCALEPMDLSPDAHRDVVRAGYFLPPESHFFLLRVMLDESADRSTGGPVRHCGDPFLFLARRIQEG